MEEQPSTSGIQQGIEVCPFTELDIAAMVVLLKRRADHFGLEGIPVEVQLSPLAPEAGWRAAALRELRQNAKAAARGEKVDLAAGPKGEGGFMESAYAEGLYDMRSKGW